MCTLSDGTCCYGIYKDGRNGLCLPTNTYASLQPEVNNAIRISFFSFGLIAFVACVRKRYLLHCHGGSTIQKQVYALMLVASFTFLLRSIDPWSHEHIYPPVVSGLWVDICGASIYSVMILFTAFYARLVVPPARLGVAEHYIRGFTCLAFFLTWGVYVFIRPLYLVAHDTNIFRSWHLLVQYAVSAIDVLVTSSAAFYCGMHVHRRLAFIQEANARAVAVDTLRQQATLTRSKMSPPVLMSMPRQFVDCPPPSALLDDTPPSPILLHDPDSFDDDDDDAVDTGYDIAATLSSAPSSSSRVWKVTMLMEACSIGTIASAVVFMLQFIRDGCELPAARRLSRDGLPRHEPPPAMYQWPVFGFIQLIAIGAIYWCFSKTKQTPTDAFALQDQERHVASRVWGGGRTTEDTSI
ncbi:Aste57867_1200 [Aphanomyces stellatus]|uniref:Aste57867_1200 protein n=1 Tax=Aphanomyces stellatus TaxID=120398 RepID=A0A485K5N6_9STRA|nr:hypothetical protein As57867_001199 [Aphanomyces stellatus]VFT78420.1 Aste57867_1200 [Aphanomyces stellatus]